MPSRRSSRSARDGAQDRSQRQLRVGEQVRHALADLFSRGDFRDPELRGLDVTVTEVRISPDLRNATAFVTPLGGGDPAHALGVLRRAAPFLRGQVARAVDLRHAPTLSFEADTTFDYAQRIETLLHDPRVARDLDEDGPEDGGRG
jgi:ribosome-binding factor A